MVIDKLATEHFQKLMKFKQELKTFGGQYRKEYYETEAELLEKCRQRIKNGKGRNLAIVDDDVDYVLEHVFSTYKELTGYDPTWVLEEFEELVNKAGAKEKYDKYTRLFFAWFVHHLVKNGASQLQSEELVLQLVKDEKTKSSSHLKRIIGDSYREFKTKGYDVDDMVLDDMDNELEFVPHIFHTLPLKGYPKSAEKAFSKALGAYAEWAKQVVDLIKRPLRRADIELPDNPIINRLRQNLDNPLDYFHGYVDLTKEQRTEATRLLWKLCRD